MNRFLLGIGAKAEAADHLAAAVRLDPTFETREDVQELRRQLAGG